MVVRGVFLAAIIGLFACNGYPDCASKNEMFNAQGQCGQSCSDGGACPNGQVCISSQQCVDPHSNCSSFAFVCSDPQ